jgi:hypothetical protein
MGAQGKTCSGAGEKGIPQMKAGGLPRRYAPRHDDGGAWLCFLSRNSEPTAHKNAPNLQIIVIASAARQSTHAFRNKTPKGKHVAAQWGRASHK